VAQRVAAAVERLVIAYLLALLIGILAGLRTMTAPAAVSWAAHLGGFASITRGSPFWDTPGHLAS